MSQNKPVVHERERKLAARLRKYGKGGLLHGDDMARAAVFIEHLTDEVERLQALIRSMVLASEKTCVPTSSVSDQHPPTSSVSDPFCLTSDDEYWGCGS